MAISPKPRTSTAAAAKKVPAKRTPKAKAQPQPVPEQPAAEERRIQTPEEALQYVATLSPEKVLAVSLDSNNQLSMASGGTMDTATALVMVGHVLAKLYVELTPQQQTTVPVSAFMNSVAKVAVNQIVVNCPDAPLYALDLEPGRAQG